MSNTEDMQFQEMDERIERFLRGQMLPAEEAQLREDLKTDAELREHARSVSALVKGIQEKGRQNDLKVINEVVTPKKSSNLHRLIIWSSSVAAALVLVIGFNFYAENARYTRINKMLSPYYEHYDPNSLSRGENDSVTIAHLYTLFNRISDEKNMKDIISELEPIYESLDSDYTYYPYANDIAWNLALAYVKSGEEEKAKEILNDLCSSHTDSPIAERAIKLLDILSTR